MWFSPEKYVTLSSTGARPDIDATVVCSYGGADGLSEHNTPNSDCGYDVRGADMFAGYGVSIRACLRG